MRVHHIGIIVKDMQKSIHIYKQLKYKQRSNIILDKKQNIRIAFMQSEDESQVLELIQAVDETSSVYHFKEGYHHICYEVENDNFIEEFKNLKIGKIFTEQIQAPAIQNRQVCFGCLNNKTFIEILF